jgi:hypothetical protein
MPVMKSFIARGTVKLPGVYSEACNCFKVLREETTLYSKNDNGMAFNRALIRAFSRLKSDL